MVKTLTTVGNSKALILPKRLVDKYKLDQVTIHETGEGILIVPLHEESDSFQSKLKTLRQNKQQVYAAMESQAKDPHTISYYGSDNTLDEIDVEILDE